MNAKNLLVLLVLFTVSTTFSITVQPTSAKPLAGHVEVENDLDAPLPEFKSLTPKLDTTRTGGIETNAPQPTWIQGKVFSNNDMFMYSFWRFMGFKKEWRWNIPTTKKTSLYFKQDIVKHWTGAFKPTNGCNVTCVPLEGGERFKFFHKNPQGPHGYLERVGETKNGFPRYRIWFEEATS